MSSQRASKVFTGVKKSRAQAAPTIIYYVQEPPSDPSAINVLSQTNIKVLNNKSTTSNHTRSDNNNDGPVIPDVLTPDQLTQATTEKGLHLHGSGIYFLTESDTPHCVKSVMTKLDLKRIGDSKILKFYWVNPPTNHVFLGNKKGEYVITMKSGNHSESARDFLIFNGDKQKAKTEDSERNHASEKSDNSDEEILFFSNKASVMLTVIRNTPGNEKIYVDIMTTGGY